MSSVIALLEKHLDEKDLRFTQKPILIGGMAMEYYGLRKTGLDIDLVVCDADYQALARAYPEQRKDIFADLGVVLEPFEIWRSIYLLDYDFYLKDAIDESAAYVVSLERLTLMRVCAMENPKYIKDLELIKAYYCQRFRNPAFQKMHDENLALYQNCGGTVYGGRYTDAP